MSTRHPYGGGGGPALAPVEISSPPPLAGFEGETGPTGPDRKGYNCTQGYEKIDSRAF
jgi:hypothetical protein